MTEISKKSNILRIIFTIVLGILPLSSLVLGIRCMLRGDVITIWFAITFLILPCVVLTVTSIAIWSKIPKLYKIIICAVYLVAFVVGSFLMLSVGRYITKEFLTGDEVFDAYPEIVSDISEFPSESELGQPEEIEYYNLNQYYGIFSCESDTLICQYNDTDYQLNKDRIEESYVFRRATKFVTPVDDYDFRMLSDDEHSSLYYPKRVMLIATNDETNEIVYILFHDPDIDYIEDEEEFILNDCGWKYIR